jgi:uncharacterized membrane protein
MRDWKALVSKCLRLRDLPKDEMHEIVTELASHLEDLHEEQIRKGVNESEAGDMVMNEVVRWRTLAQKIQRAKLTEETMNTRTKHLWLPGLVSLTMAMFSPLLVAFMRLGDLPQYVWLALLPICGGAAAYLSRRSGGQPFERIVSALFPVGALLACFCFILLVSALATIRFFTVYDFVHYTKWAVPQAAALLLGAFPFLRRSEPRNRVGTVLI